MDATEKIIHLRAELNLWYEARLKLAKGGVKSYVIHNRQLQYQDLPTINEQIDKLENEIDQLQSGRRSRIRSMPIIMRDF